MKTRIVLALLLVVASVSQLCAQQSGDLRGRTLILNDGGSAAGTRKNTILIAPQDSTSQTQDYTLLLPAAPAPAINAVLQVESLLGTTAYLKWTVAPSIDVPVIFEEQQQGSFNIRRRTAFMSGPQGSPGLGAFDAQASRELASQTASGQYAGILSGRSNTSSGQLSLAVGGDSNIATARHSTILGGRNNLSSDVYALTLSGYRNRATNDYALVVSGNYNLADGILSAIVTGDSNSIDGTSDTSVIINGSSNRITASMSSTILSGNDNKIGQAGIPTTNSIILGGGGVTVKSSNTLVWSGTNSLYQIDDANAAVVHNADLVLTNSTASSSRLTFMEPSTSATYPNDNTVSLRAGAMTSNTSYVLPATLGSVGQVPRIASISGSEATLDWLTVSATFSGSPTQVAFFKSASELSSSSDVAWDTLNRTFTLINTSKPSELLSLSKSGAQTSNDTAMSILVTTTSTSTLTKRGLLISSTGSWTGTNVGLAVTASGGTSNYAALFSSGRVGIGDDTPDATLDLDGDLAYTEYSYTGTLTATNNDVDFDGNDNRFALVRVGTQTAARTITGFEGGVAGKTFNLINASGYPIIIEAQSTGSVAANRIITPDNDKVAIAHRSSAQFVYSGVDSRWYVSATSPSNVVSFPPTDQTVAGTGSVLASSTSAYLRINNTSGSNQNVTLEDGVTVGQVIIVQLITTSAKNITLTGANLIASASDSNLTAGQAVILVWDGTYWQVSAAKGG
jgi:hypothetical protein